MAADSSNNRKIVISASSATVTSREKPYSFPDVVQDAPAAELAAKKKENQKQEEIQLASKGQVAEFDVPARLLDDKFFMFLKLVSEYSTRSSGIPDL
ncbi:hypothetical protein AgCh_028068 [Apium graveolens]